MKLYMSYTYNDLYVMNAITACVVTVDREPNSEKDLEQIEKDLMSVTGTDCTSVTILSWKVLPDNWGES